MLISGGLLVEMYRKWSAGSDMRMFSGTRDVWPGRIVRDDDEKKWWGCEETMDEGQYCSLNMGVCMSWM